MKASFISRHVVVLDEYAQFTGRTESERNLQQQNKLHGDRFILRYQYIYGVQLTHAELSATDEWRQ